MVDFPILHARPWETDLWIRGPVPHLTWLELDCNDGTPYPLRWRRTRALPLGTEFEMIRAAAGGRPLKVGSAYRTEEWNRRVGGARHSKHVDALALDLQPPSGMLLPSFLDVVIGVAHRPGSLIRGIGVYRTFVHMDIRPGDRIARWRGSRVTSEVWGRLSNA